MIRFESILLAFFLACWMVAALLSLVDIVPPEGNLNITLYPFYALAAFMGWIAGNVYVARSRGLPRPLRRRVLIAYYMGPPGVLFLLRGMASREVQEAAPFVPLYAFGVYTVFFLVPVSLRGTFHSRRDVKIGKHHGDD